MPCSPLDWLGPREADYDSALGSDCDGIVPGLQLFEVSAAYAVIWQDDATFFVHTPCMHHLPMFCLTSINL